MSPPLPGAPRVVVGALSYSEGRQECIPKVWYSSEIDAFKFILHILSDTPGGFQWQKYILLMEVGDWICRSGVSEQIIGESEHVRVGVGASMLELFEWACQSC